MFTTKQWVLNRPPYFQLLWEKVHGWWTLVKTIKPGKLSHFNACSSDPVLGRMFTNLFISWRILFSKLHIFELLCCCRRTICEREKTHRWKTSKIVKPNYWERKVKDPGHHWSGDQWLYCKETSAEHRHYWGCIWDVGWMEILTTERDSGLHKYLRGSQAWWGWNGVPYKAGFGVESNKNS